MQKHPFLYTNKETKTTKFNQHFFSGLIVSITTTTFVFVIDVSFNHSSRLYNWRSTTTTIVVVVVVGSRKTETKKTEKKYWSMIDQSIDQESKWMNFFSRTNSKQTNKQLSSLSTLMDLLIFSFILLLNELCQKQNNNKTKQKR